MKTTLFTLLMMVLFAAACNSGAKTGKPMEDAPAVVSADTTAKAAESAKNSTDSLVNAAPDTIRAK